MCDEVVRRIAKPRSLLCASIAVALVNKGYSLGTLNRHEEEITVYDDVAQRFGDAVEPACANMSPVLWSTRQSPWAL